ncbi:hypothetical protein HZA41_02815 [Candidatus Peregrinibacteria bacterium]|nr:hypothetical protein [Candidatus Peregrinibacteria bacterium]
MSIINFTITQPFEKKVQKVIKEQGFTSKAEFFRFSALFFIYNIPKIDITEAEYQKGINEFTTAVSKKFKNTQFPSLEEQFADLR